MEIPLEVIFQLDELIRWSLLCVYVKTLLKSNFTDGKLFSGWRQMYEDDSFSYGCCLWDPLLDYYDIFQSEHKPKKKKKNPQSVSNKRGDLSSWGGGESFTLLKRTSSLRTVRLKPGIKYDGLRVETQTWAKLGELGHLHTSALHPTSTIVSLIDLKRFVLKLERVWKKLEPSEISLFSDSAVSR